MHDAEATFKQLPGNLALDALPAQTPEDQRMKRIVRTVCTGCHTPSFPLQHRFDEAGWNAIIELMKNANVYGTYVGGERKPSGILDFHQKELAAYLARARGPDDTEADMKLEPRPSGEAARVMFKEYDLPLDPDANLPADFVQNDGSDWSLGTPSVLIPGWGVHDAWLDLAGNLWFTCNIPNKRTTIGRVDTATGEVKLFKVAGPNGLAAQAHGMTRDPNGIIWFNVNNGRGGIGRLDPTTQRIDVYLPPTDMTQTGGAATVDYDGHGNIWSSAPDGALRFDPVAEKFTEFKSITYKTVNGVGITYGTAADRDGNGYWAEMILDTIGVGDGRSGSVSEIKLAPVEAQQALLTPDERQYYATYNQPDFNSPLPWAARPAPHGHRQERRHSVDRQFMGRQSRPHRYPHARRQLHPTARRAAALSCRRRPRPRCLDQPVGGRPRHALRSQGRHLDRVRPADPRRRAAVHLALGTRRSGHQSRPALLPRPQGRGHDVAQPGGDRCAQGASGSVIRHSGARTPPASRNAAGQNPIISSRVSVV